MSSSRRPGIPGVFDAALQERPLATAVVARSGELTYAQLDRAADLAAGALWDLGIRPGDRVAGCLPNDLDVVAAFHGAMRLGAIWVGIGEALAPMEKQHLLQDCQANLLIAAEQVLVELPVAGVGRSVALEDWQGRQASSSEAPPVAVDVHAAAGIAYTSGTTGLPKGIVHSQHNLLLPGEVLIVSRGWGPALRKGDCLPLTILNMMVLTTLLTAQAGGCCIVMDRRDSEGILRWLADGRVTHWNGVPAQLYDLARTAAAPGLEALQEVWCGAGDCPESLRVDFNAAFGVPIRATYGLTEAPTVVAIDPVGDKHRPAASGQVLPHLTVSAYDESGRPVASGEIGELAISARQDGPWAGRWTPALGTWRDGSVQDAPSLPLRTGDLGTIDAEGYLSVVDRLKLVIIRGGANVYPAEVERVLVGLPGVAGAAVFGVADDRLGQRVVALIELDPSAGTGLHDLRDACANQLARYKVPEEWVQVPTLPRNAMGKVERGELAALLVAASRPDPLGGAAR